MKLASLPVSPNDTIAQSDVRSTIGEALDQMESADREILLLVAWEGLAPREIAVALGVSSATIRMRLSRARTRFKKALEIQNSPDALIDKEQM